MLWTNCFAFEASPDYRFSRAVQQQLWLDLCCCTVTLLSSISSLLLPFSLHFILCKDECGKGATLPSCYMLVIFIMPVPEAANRAPGPARVFWPCTQRRRWGLGAIELLHKQSGHSGVNIKSPDTHLKKGSGSHYSIPFTLQKFMHPYKLC